MPKITSTKRSQHSLGFHPYRTNKEEDDEVVAGKTNINAPNLKNKKTSIEDDDSGSEDGGDAQGANNDNGKLLSRGQRKRQERKEKVMQKLGLKQPQLKNSNTAGNNNEQATTSIQSTSQQLPRHQTLERTQAILLSTLNEMQEEQTNMDQDEEEDSRLAREQFLALATSSAAISTNKLKKEVAIRESTRIKQIQQHPSFQENPINAIQQHLQQLVGKTLTATPSQSTNSSNDGNVASKKASNNSSNSSNKKDKKGSR